MSQFFTAVLLGVAVLLFFVLGDDRKSSVDPRLYPGWEGGLDPAPGLLRRLPDRDGIPRSTRPRPRQDWMREASPRPLHPPDARQPVPALPPLRLAFAFLHGDGVPIDYGRAAYWFAEAALLGDPVALFNLGVMHENGLGVRRDPEIAYRLFERAAETGYPGALQKLGGHGRW